MAVKTQQIELHSSGDLQPIDITEQAAAFVAASGLSEGVLTAFCRQGTCAVVTMEFEPGLLEDLTHLFERLAPMRDAYRHNQRCRAMDGHAHLRALLSGSSTSVPFRDGKLLLGDGQQLVFIDFGPGPDAHPLILQALGE